MPAKSPSTKPRGVRIGSPSSAMPALAPFTNSQASMASGLDSPQPTLSSLSATSLRKGSDVVLPPQLRGTSESVNSSSSSNYPSPTIRTSPSASANNRSTGHDGTTRSSRDALNQPLFNSAAPSLTQVPKTKPDTGRIVMPTAKSFNDTGFDRTSVHQAQKRTNRYMAASMELPGRELQEMSLHSLPAMQPSAINAFRGSSRTASKTSSLAPSPSSVFTVPGSHPTNCNPALELADLDTVLHNAGSMSFFDDDLHSPYSIPQPAPVVADTRTSGNTPGTGEEHSETIRSYDRTPSTRHLQALADQAQFTYAHFHLNGTSVAPTAPTQPSEGSETSEPLSALSKVRVGKRSVRPLAQRTVRRLKTERPDSGTSSSSHSGSADSSVQKCICRSGSPRSCSDGNVPQDRRKKNSKRQKPSKLSRKPLASPGARDMELENHETQSPLESSPFSDFRRHHRRQQQQQLQPLCENSPSTSTTTGSNAPASPLELLASFPQPPPLPTPNPVASLRGNTAQRGSASRDTFPSTSDDSHPPTTRSPSTVILSGVPTQIINVPLSAFSASTHYSSSKEETDGSKRNSESSNLPMTPLFSSFSRQGPGRTGSLVNDRPLVDLVSISHSRPTSRLQDNNASSLTVGDRESVMSPPNLSATNMWGEENNNNTKSIALGLSSMGSTQQNFSLSGGCTRLGAPRMVTQTRTEIVSHELPIPLLSTPSTEASCAAAGELSNSKCAPIVRNPTTRPVSSLLAGNHAVAAHPVASPVPSTSKRMVVKERPKSSKRNAERKPTQRSPSNDPNGKKEATTPNHSSKSELTSGSANRAHPQKKNPTSGTHRMSISSSTTLNNEVETGKKALDQPKPQPSVRQTTTAACASTSFSSGNLRGEGSTLSSTMVTPRNPCSPSATQLATFHSSGLADFGSLRNHGSTASMDPLGVLRSDQYGGSSFFCGFRRLDSGINGEYANASFSRASEQSKSGNISHARLLFTSDHIPPMSKGFGAVDGAADSATEGKQNAPASTKKRKGESDPTHGKQRKESNRQGDGGADGHSTDSENDGASASFSDEESDSGASCISSKDYAELLEAIRGGAPIDPEQEPNETTTDSQRDISASPLATETKAQRRPLKSFFRLYYLPYDRYNRPKNPMTVLMAGAYRNSPPPVSAATQPPPPPSPWSFRRQGERKADVPGRKSPAQDGTLQKLSSGSRLNSVSGLASLRSDELLVKPNWKASNDNLVDESNAPKSNHDSPQQSTLPSGMNNRRRSTMSQSPRSMSVAALCSPNSDGVPNGGMFPSGVPQSSFTTASLQSFAGNISPSCGYPCDGFSGGTDGGAKTPQDSTTFYPFFSTAGRIAAFERHGTGISGATSNLHHHTSYGQSLASVSSSATMDGFYGTPTNSTSFLQNGASSPDRVRRRKQTASPGLAGESFPAPLPPPSNPPSDSSSPKCRQSRGDEPAARSTKDSEGDPSLNRSDNNKPERLSFDSSAIMFRPKRQSSVTSDSKGTPHSPHHDDTAGNPKHPAAAQKLQGDTTRAQPLPVNESLQSLQDTKQLGSSTSVTMSSAPRFPGMSDALVGFSQTQLDLVSASKAHPEQHRHPTLHDLDCLGEMVTGTISTSSENLVVKALVYDPDSTQLRVSEKSAEAANEQTSRRVGDDDDVLPSASSSEFAANSRPDTSMDSFHSPFASTAPRSSGHHMPLILETRYSQTNSSPHPSPKNKAMLRIPIKTRATARASQDAAQKSPNGSLKPSGSGDHDIQQSDSQVGSLTSPTPPASPRHPGFQCTTCGSKRNTWGETLCNCSQAASPNQTSGITVEPPPPTAATAPRPALNITTRSIPSSGMVLGEEALTNLMSSRSPALESPNYFASRSREQQQQQSSTSFSTKASRDRGETIGSVYASVDAAAFARAVDSSNADRPAPRGQSCRVTPLHGEFGQNDPQPHMVFHSQRGSWRNNVKSSKNDNTNVVFQRGNANDNLNFYYYYYVPNQRAWGSFSARGGASGCAADGDCPRGAVSVTTPTLSSRNRPQPHFGSGGSYYPTSPVIASPLPGIPQFTSRSALESGNTESRSNPAAMQRTTYQRNPSWQIQSVSSTLSSLSFSRSQRHPNQSWSFSVQKPLREQEYDSFIEMERKPQPNSQEPHCGPMDLSRGVINLHGTAATPVQLVDPSEGPAEASRGGGASSPQSSSFRRKSVSPSNQRRAVSFKGFSAGMSGQNGSGLQNAKLSSATPLLGGDRPYPSREPTPHGDSISADIQQHNQEDPLNSTYDRVASSGNVESILMKHPLQSWRSGDANGPGEQRKASRAAQGRLSSASSQPQQRLAKGSAHERKRGDAARNTSAAPEDPFARHFPKQIGSYDVPPRRYRHGSDETHAPLTVSNESSTEFQARGAAQEPYSPRANPPVGIPADLELCPPGQDLATFLSEQQAIQWQQKAAMHVRSARSQTADSSVLSVPPQLHRTDPLTVTDASEDQGYNTMWVGSPRGYGPQPDMEMMAADEQTGLFHLPLVLRNDEETDEVDMMGYHEDDYTGMGFTDQSAMESEAMHAGHHFRRDGSYSRNNMSPCLNGSTNNYIPAMSLSQMEEFNLLSRPVVLEEPRPSMNDDGMDLEGGEDHARPSRTAMERLATIVRRCSTESVDSSSYRTSTSDTDSGHAHHTSTATTTPTTVSAPGEPQR